MDSGPTPSTPSRRRSGGSDDARRSAPGRRGSSWRRVDLDHLQWLAGEPDGSAWLARVPTLVAECAANWSLQLGSPYRDAHVSFAAPAMTVDGRPAVLKLQYPHPECQHEGEALRRWNGDGAIRLLDADEARNALLLERCDPGLHLGRAPSMSPPRALDVLVELISRLSIPGDDAFRSLTDEAAMWIEHLHDPRRTVGLEPTLVAAAVDRLRGLGDPVGGVVLLHQDLHGDNVLSSTRAPWLAIDPKPLTGDPAFAVAPVVRSFELGETERDVRYRFDRLCADLELDRERARAWTIGQTMAWAGSSGHGEWCQQVVRWLLEP